MCIRDRLKGADTKKLVLLNIPYILVGYFCDKVAWLWRVSPGNNASDKMMAEMCIRDRLLIKDERFKGLSSDAKLLYGLMLDRLSLSMKNGWLDSENRAYIIYTIDNIMEDLGCSKPTCTKIMRELDCDNGIGLIEKKRRGLGKPDIIYVKNFVAVEEKTEEKEPANTDDSTEVKDFNFKKERILTSGSKESELLEVKDFDLQKQKDLTSGSKESEPQEVKGFVPNYTNYNHTNQSNTDMNDINPINQSGSCLLYTSWLRKY